LLDRQNQIGLDSNTENREKTPTAHNEEDHANSVEGHKEEDEGRSNNAFDQRKPKRTKIELQGELKKIRPSLFEGDSEEVTEAWLIVMGKYFQIYEYTEKIKARLAVY